MNQEVESALQQLQQVFSGRLDSIWLVGGTIRDLLEKHAPKDFDFAFAGDLTPQIRSWASQQGGHWFWLDKIRNQSRVLFPNKGLQFDFAPLRAETINADLRLRDFTLNAMGLEFKSFFDEKWTLIDPINGQQDLEKGILRSCGPNVLTDDPLRVLKGVRHHALRGWQFDDQTTILMAKAAALLVSVAGERIKNELGHIFESPRLVSAIETMERYDILDNLFPGIVKHGLTQELALLTVRFDELMKIPYFAALLGQSIEEGLTRKTLLLLAALVRRVDSLADVAEISQRLRLSTRSRSILQALCEEPISLESFVDTDTPRITALKFESFGKDCMERILFALACLKTNNQDLLLSTFFGVYEQQLDKDRIADLLDGREIISRIDLSQGRIIGSYQKRIKAAEIAGEITCKRTAVDWLKRQLND